MSTRNLQSPSSQRRQERHRYKQNKDKKQRKHKDKKYSRSISPQDDKLNKNFNRQRPREKSRQKDKYRERRDRNYEEDRRKKDKHSKRYRERSRSRSKDRISKRDQRDKKQKRGKSIEKPREKSRSPSGQKNNTEISQQERLRRIQLRQVRARLMKLEDALGGDISDSSSESEVIQQNKKPINMPQLPQMPKLPPMPPKQTPPAPAPVAKTKPKKQSRWGKTTSNQSSIFPTAEPISETSNVQKDQKLTLQPQHSQDIKLSLSEDKSIEVEQHQNQVGPKLDVIDQEYVDPLDQYMMQIEQQAVPQLFNPKQPKKKVITFDQAITTQPMTSTTMSDTLGQNQDQDEKQQKFKNTFLNAIQKLGHQNNQNEQKEQRGIVIQNNEQLQEEFQDNLMEQNENQLDFFAKQRKMAERKELGFLDHSKIQYEDVKFNLYREAEEVKNMNYKDVVKYRKQAGDIKVRGREVPNPILNWYQCGLNDKILSVIEKRQYTKPFPIQAQSLPLIMSGRDVIGIAETGSGKTLSYLLPALKHISAQRPVQQGEGPVCLIMTPTRQLARQVYLEAKAFCKSTPIRVIAAYGGLGVQAQLSDFRKGAQLVVCTPGRMIDILGLNKGKITNLKRVTLIVIDQADRMFDLGFEPQITRIIQNARPKKQVVMFSATFPKNVQNLARRILINPVEIIVGSRGQACRNVQQIVYVLDETSKFLKLLEVLGQWNEKGSILIFVDKQTQVDYLFQQLLKYGYPALTLHGAMDPDDRQFTIYDFKKGLRNIMIATSVCARGLDIKAICLVVNFKCPNHLQDYIHRIGRTGRAGTKGTAVTFITPEQDQYSIDLIKALQMSDVHPPQQLKKLSQAYLGKVKKGQARKIRNRNLMGSGFKFDEQEQERVNVIKNALKKQLKSQGLGGFESSDEEDIQMKKKKEENIRGRSQQDRIAQALKNPEIKNKLVSEAVKAVSEAMKSDNKLSTEKILQVAISSMKQSVTKHKVVTTVQDGVQKVSQLINEFQNKGIQGTDFFSYDFEINDYPLNARQKACNQTFLKDVQHQTNCTVSLRGVYVEPGKKVPIGCRKLYLHIQGQNKYYVTTAYKQIKSVLQQSAYETLHGGMGPGKYTI